VKLVWAITDNLGDWAVIRKRLNEELQGKSNAPLRDLGAAAFQPFVTATGNDSDLYFARELGAKVREASQIGWSPENPGKGIPGEGKNTWSGTPHLSPDGLLVAPPAPPPGD